uniref:GtrA family protein n=1 Tax=Cyanothece sp. (strain PCC 7425 / ATCC 29141) TaxID=395961 RepID=B8HMN1_CYAP4
MMRKLLKSKQLRFAVLGVITACFNLMAITLLVELFHLKTPLQRNIANIAAMEISLIFSFFVYRLGVWTHASWQFQQVFLRQIPLYHVASGLTVVLRSLLIFPVLDWLKINYFINTLIGIALAAILSYLFNDRLVFPR